jgi:hypothetical protein
MWLELEQQLHTRMPIPPSAYPIGHEEGFVKKFRDRDVMMRRKAIQAEIFDLFVNFRAGLIFISILRIS